MRIDAPISNYYGTPFVFKKDGRFYYALDTYSGGQCVEVSEAFANAYAAEFPPSEGHAYSSTGKSIYDYSLQARGSK